MINRVKSEDLIDAMVNMMYLKPKEDINVNISSFLTKPYVTIEYKKIAGGSCL